MTVKLTCAQCSRTAGTDEAGSGPLGWVHISPIGPGDPTTDSPAEPPGWTLCSPDCVRTWAAERADAASADTTLAPAGLYLG